MVVVLASLNNLTFEINFRDRKIAGGQKQRRLFWEGSEFEQQLVGNKSWKVRPCHWYGVDENKIIMATANSFCQIFILLTMKYVVHSFDQ